MKRIVQSHHNPGATSCVLLGELDSWPEVMKPYRKVLWIRAGAVPAGLVSPGVALTVFEVANEAAGALEQALEAFVMQDGRRMPSVVCAEGLERQLAAGLLGRVLAVLEENHRARVTRAQDAYLWQQHVLANLGGYLGARLPESWRGAAAGLPAFVCGAGPSFDVSAPVLARHAHKGLVLAGDSSLRKLALQGVRADVAVSIDVAKRPEGCLPADTAMQPARVLLSCLSPAGWQTAVSGDTRYYIASNQLTIDWLVKQGVGKPVLNAAENCGATALELACFLGCAPIYLFGMDLALTEDGGQVLRHHGQVDAKVYSNSGFKAEARHPRVKGNHGQVSTHVLGDLRLMSRRVSAYPSGLVHNVNDRGAYIENTTVVAPQDFALPEPLGEGKAGVLARLAFPESVSPEACERVQRRLVVMREQLERQVERLREVLATRSVERVVQAWRELLADGDRAYCLGAFSFKMMPHLIPPVEASLEDCARWLEELEVLVAALPKS